MSIYNRIDAFVSKHQLISPGQTIIVGLSGGPDSVYLLHYLLQKKEFYDATIIAAHLNHEWRDSAQVDESFCIELCRKLDVPLVTKKMSELNLDIKPSGSKEQDARHARRSFLEHLARFYNADTIAVAHHADDQIETFFIRLMRGAGLTGLAGMRPKNGKYIRPLLSISKKDIMTWLEEQNVSYVIDPTNESFAYLRNRIRHKLIPLMHEIDDRFINSCKQTLERLQDTELFLAHLTKQAFSDIAVFDRTKKVYVVDKQKFMALEPVLRYRVLVDWLAAEKVHFPVTQAFFDEIIRFIGNSENKPHSLHNRWKLIKTKSNMYIQSNQ